MGTIKEGDDKERERRMERDGKSVSLLEANDEIHKEVGVGHILT